MDEISAPQQWHLFYCGLLAGISISLSCVSPWLGTLDSVSAESVSDQSTRLPIQSTDLEQHKIAPEPVRTAAVPDWLSSPLKHAPVFNEVEQKFPAINVQANIPRPLPPLGEDASPLPRSAASQSSATAKDQKAIDQTSQQIAEDIWSEELEDLPDEAAQEIRKLHQILEAELQPER